jgi:hypothetical protein
MPICPIWGTPCTDAGSNDEFYFVDSSRAGGRYKLFGSALEQVKNLTIDEKRVVTSWIVSQHQMFRKLWATILMKLTRPPHELR